MKLFQTLKSVALTASATVLATMSLAVMAPALVSAAPCVVAGGSGGGGASLLILNANISAADSTVLKVSQEFTPSQAWAGTSSLNTNDILFAKANCTADLSSIGWSITGQVLSIRYADSNRTGAFVATTDYTNVLGGVNVTSTSNTLATATYTMPTISAAAAQTVSIDRSNAGWIDVWLKQGAGADTRLVSFKADVGAAAFLNTGSSLLTSIIYDETNAFGSCSQITGSKEAKVRILFDGVATSLTAAPTTFATCGNFDKTSYDVATKTASLKYDTANIMPNHQVFFDLTNPFIAINLTSTLTTTPDKQNFIDYFIAGNSASQQFYFSENTTVDGQAIPKNTPFPVVGGVMDLSTANTDLGAKGVTFDTSNVAHTALAHNFGLITKNGTFSLFVPYKDKDNFVGVCAGATTLAAVNGKCSGVYYLKDGQTKTSKDTTAIAPGHSVKAAVITVGTTKFWQVDGLTGTGGFSTTLATDPATGLHAQVISPQLAIVGVVATIIFLAGARYSAGKH